MTRIPQCMTTALVLLAALFLAAPPGAQGQVYDYDDGYYEDYDRLYDAGGFSDVFDAPYEDYEYDRNPYDTLRGPFGDRDDYDNDYDDGERGHYNWFGGYDDAGEEGIFDW